MTHARKHMKVCDIGVQNIGWLLGRDPRDLLLKHEQGYNDAGEGLKMI